MRLLREIAELAVSSQEPLTNVLRKCLILNASLKNDTLKTWLNKELNGYDSDDKLPDYRLINIHAKGTFHGPAGSGVNNATLPPMIMPEEFRHWGNLAKLTQGVAAYDAAVKSGSQDPLKIPWPQDLVLYVQSDFYRGYTLAEAWQVLPMSSLTTLCDTVRNRVIDFALEVDETLSGYGEDVKSMPKSEVTKSVTNIIYGNNNIMSGNSRDIIYRAESNVSSQDWCALADIVSSLGFSDSHIAELKQAIDEDANASMTDGIGPKTASWLGTALGYVSRGGAKVGIEVASKTLTAAITNFLDLT